MEKERESGSVTEREGCVTEGVRDSGREKGGLRIREE